MVLGTKTDAKRPRTILTSSSRCWRRATRRVELPAMKTDELRETYLTFFESKGCVRRPSDVLVPKGDPTVLFTPQAGGILRGHQGPQRLSKVRTSEVKFTVPE